MNWTKIGAVGVGIAGLVGGLLGSMLSSEHVDTVISWTDAGKGALTAVVSVLLAFGTALVTSRKSKL